MRALRALSGGKRGLQWASQQRSQTLRFGACTSSHCTCYPRGPSVNRALPPVVPGEGAVRDASPITLASITREEGFPLERHEQGSIAQGGHGCCLPNSGLCQTHRNPSVEGHHVVLEDQSISGRKAGPSGMVSGLHVWGPVLGSH